MFALVCRRVGAGGGGWGRGLLGPNVISALAGLGRYRPLPLVLPLPLSRTIVYAEGTAMKCDRCDNDSTVHEVTVRNGVKVEKHLCKSGSADE